MTQTVAQKQTDLDARLDAAIVLFNQAKGTMFEELRWNEALKVLDGYTFAGTPA